MAPTYLRLREIREQRNLTQMQLAELSGVPQSTISRWETGYTKVVDLEVLDQLARALKLRSTAELFGGSPTKR